MIRLLWPTVRPKVMKQTYHHWIKTADTPNNITIKIAVNTEKQRDQLNEFDDIIIIGDDRRGPVYATHKLAKAVRGDARDIIILVSDDYYSPRGWDTWLRKQFHKFDGALMVNDGYQVGKCVPLPIMTYGCLLSLNRIIYHPSYTWQYSDEELYHNLVGMRKLKNMRKPDQPVFEHRHWCNNKRSFDENDKYGTESGGADHKNFQKRMRLTVRERLK